MVFTLGLVRLISVKKKRKKMTVTFAIVTFAMNNFVFQITFFGLAGGLTVKETVWRVMAKLVTYQ